MDLQLVNKEICEARLYQTSRQFNALNGRDVADLIFLMTMTTYMLSRENETSDIAREYAKKTAQHGTYSIFRTAVTDLYMLCYQAKHPDNDHVKLDDLVASKQFLNDLSFHVQNHITFMRKIATADANDQYAYSYFYRLETQLKIKDARYKAWRRVISGWSKARSSEKDRVKKQISKEFKRMGRGTVNGSELQRIMLSTMSDRSRKDVMYSKDTVSKDQPSTAKRIAGTVAGAAAGRYVGGKLAKMDKAKAKNVGTGIGAIAGYWASGRRSQS